MSEISLGLELMKYGLLGVFSVLILFYVMIFALMKIFPYRNEENNN